MAKETKEKAVTHTVLIPFRDKDDFSILHETDKDVSDFEEDRLAKLVEQGLVKKS